jgi:magnesium transporter
LPTTAIDPFVANGPPRRTVLAGRGAWETAGDSIAAGDANDAEDAAEDAAEAAARRLAPGDAVGLPEDVASQTAATTTTRPAARAARAPSWEARGRSGPIGAGPDAADRESPPLGGWASIGSRYAPAGTLDARRSPADVAKRIQTRLDTGRGGTDRGPAVAAPTSAPEEAPPDVDVPRLSMPPPGTAGGIETSELAGFTGGYGSSEPVTVTCVDYCVDQVEIQEVADLREFLGRHRPAWARVRWINVDGLGRMDVIGALAEKYGLHPLAIEDILRTHERAKAEDFPGSEDQPGRLFVVARTIDQRDGRLHSDQLSMFLGRTTLLTFQGTHRQDLAPIRQRITTPGSRLRENDASFLLYVLLDGIVDRYFPVLEHYSERLGDLEEEVLDRPSRDTLEQIHRLKRELLTIRRAAWPLRELIAHLQRERHETLSETSQTYLRDVQDHCIQIIDLVESYREIASAQAETYVSVVSAKTNDIMKVLTIIGTIFIPLTFLAGVYGMNMPIPENASPIAYPAFWLVCVALAGGMLVWFRRRGWL